MVATDHVPTRRPARGRAQPDGRTVITLAGPPGLDLARRSLEVAPLLLGAVLSHGGVDLELTEVEAYEGVDDPASHAWRGPTPRSSIMFGPPGFVYVYLSHGLHHAVNLVCGPDGTASAVLLRAGRVTAGIGVARSRRLGVADVALARGPGNLTRALGIDLACNGSRLGVHPGATARQDRRPVTIRSGPRVGVSRAAGRPWRFWMADEPSVSAYRRAVRIDESHP